MKIIDEKYRLINLTFSTKIATVAFGGLISLYTVTNCWIEATLPEELN